MKTTPVYAFPVAEGVDARRNFPATVDEPRTQAIEDQFIALEAQADLSGGRAVRMVEVTGTTSTSGFLTVSAASVGLSTIDAAVASVQWTLGSGGPHWANPRIDNNTLQVLVFSMDAIGGASNISLLPSTEVTVRLVAWGSP